MKKILLVIALIVFGAFTLFAQEAAGDTTTETATTEESTSGENGASDEEQDIISKLDMVVPRFPGIDSINDRILQLKLDRLTNYVAVIRDDYLFRVVYKIDKILSDYTNDYYIDTNNIDYADLNVFYVVAGAMSSDGNVELGLRTANDAIVYFNNSVAPLNAIGKTNETAQIDYHLNLYAGILNMYKGGPTHFKQALHHFYHIIDNPLVTEDIEMYLRLNTYVASLCNDLVYYQYNNDPLRKYYYNEMFNALWNIVDKGTENEDIKNAKFNILINEYHTILYTDTDLFNHVYSKHFDRLGYTYADTEGAILEKEQTIDEKGVSSSDSSSTEGTENNETASDTAAE